VTKRIALVIVAIFAGLLAFVVTRRRASDVPCGPGLVRDGARCCVPGAASCTRAASCPAPLVATPRGCDAPERDVVVVPAVTVTMGPSDWEAEGRVAPRTLQVEAFAIDRFEVSAGRACAFFGAGPWCEDDAARAASSVDLERARAYCRARGGRLPTEDEWLAAAAGDKPRRYPWGDTGAVCRRAAWGLADGPCARGAEGPDTVGAHPEGQTPLGIQDLAGNVAEWVEPGAGPPAVRGGSWRTELATHLRTWLRHEAAPEGDRTIGFRCAYGGVGWQNP